MMILLDTYLNWALIRTRAGTGQMDTVAQLCRFGKVALTDAGSRALVRRCLGADCYMLCASEAGGQPLGEALHAQHLSSQTAPAQPQLGGIQAKQDGSLY